MKIPSSIRSSSRKLPRGFAKVPIIPVRTWLYDSLFFLPAEEVNAELEKFKGNLDASLKDLALQLREEPRQMGAAARAWLKQLASSSLRNDLAVETKLAIAYESPPGLGEFLVSLAGAAQKANLLPAKRSRKKSGPSWRWNAWTCCGSTPGASN